MQEPPERSRETPGPPADDRLRPATVDDVRGVRRWLLVAGVWAIAATAIAVIALVQANRIDEEELNARTADQIRDVQGRLEDRIESIESRIGELPTSEDISDLDRRLGEIEDQAGTTTDRLDQLRGRLDDLEQQVDELEQTQTQTEAETSP
jgi:septal ring factor EnvC (AmiA/AmiB activator)